MSVAKVKQVSFIVTVLAVGLACQTAPPVPSSQTKSRIASVVRAGIPPIHFQGLAADYRLETLVGNGESDFNDGLGTAAMLSYPWGLASDIHGNIYVADRFNHRIRKVTPTGQITTIAGHREPALRNGDALQARFDNPVGLALDQQGQLFIADTGNHLIRLLTSAGQVFTLAGGKAGFSDGSAAVGQFRNPSAIALNQNGYLYIADTQNHRIRRLSPDNKTIETVAGTGEQGWQDGTALKARFFSPRSLAFDTQGNLYISDGFNHCIRKLSTDGAVITVAGNRQAGFRDGAAAQAQFHEPQGITVDAAGNLYVADTNNHRIRLLKASGTVSTLIGGSPGYAEGDIASGRLRAPTDIALVAPRTIYIADSQNHRIRRLR